MMAELLMILNIRPGSDAMAKKKATEADIKVKEMEEREKQLQQQAATFDEMLAKDRFNTLNQFTPDFQGVTFSANFVKVGCNAVVAAPNCQSQLDHHKSQVDILHKQCEAFSASYQSELQRLKDSWHKEK